MCAKGRSGRDGVSPSVPWVVGRGGDGPRVAEWLGTLSTVLGNTGRTACLPTDALLQGLALAAQRLVENKGGVGAHRIHLAIGSPLSSEEVRGLGVPLRLGQDVADFIVGQAQYKGKTFSSFNVNSEK